ncbi:DnaJ domain-containing protein [Cladophialophora immunda]|nr:DnaJ domain-containing protein [Cladophialophora immunda]
MASPIPPDPYVALGVSKEADLSTIRSAHRKLALKYHPDRIKDEALREKGKDEFQKIQEAYEILSDPARRQRYDDQVRLAELRKESMMRDPPPSSTTTRTYPMRPAPQAATSQPRDYNDQGNYFEEIRQPRDSYEYRDPYDDKPPRATSRKYAEFERRPAPPPKTSEKSRKPTGVWPGMPAAMAAGKFKAQAEKIRNSKADEKRNDKEKRRERTDKAQTRRPANFEGTDSDSDYTEIRPSMKSSRSKTTSAFDRPSERPRPSPRAERSRDLEEESFDEKWERHHEESKAYMAKANNRPSLDRNGSDAYQYWIGESKGSGRKSGSDNEKRPGSSKGRRTLPDDYFPPSFTKSTTSPSNLRAHVEERIPSRPTTRERERERERDHDRERERERERERDRDRGDHRRPPPGLHRSQTTPIPKVSSSRKDSAPAKGSNLKHGETTMHDSGYGSSSSPHTPEMREESPPRSGKSRYPSTTSTKYQIVDPDPDADDYGRAPRLREVYGEYDDRSHRRYHHSPEPIVVEPSRDSDRRKERPERPRVDTKKSRGAAMMQDFIPPSPTMRRSDSARYEERQSPRSPRDTPPISRNNSGREKSFGETLEDREPSRYTRPYPTDKVHITPRREPQYSQYEYREPDDRSRFRDAPRMTPRRPSVNAY